MILTQNKKPNKEEEITMFEYLKKEMKSLETERKYHLEHGTERDPKMGLKLIILLAIIFSVFSCPKLHGQVSQYSPKSIVEWVCSCGYDNYDGIRYCPLCGGER